MKLQLKRLRKEAHLTQEELASKLGTTKRIVGAWERQETEMPLEDAIEIANIFDCTLDELAGRERPKREYSDDRQADINELYSYLDDANRNAAVGAVRGIAAAQAEEKTTAERAAPGARRAG